MLDPMSVLWRATASSKGQHRVASTQGTQGSHSRLPPGNTRSHASVKTKGAAALDRTHKAATSRHQGRSKKEGQLRLRGAVRSSGYGSSKPRQLFGADRKAKRAPSHRRPPSGPGVPNTRPLPDLAAALGLHTSDADSVST